MANLMKFFSKKSVEEDKGTEAEARFHHSPRKSRRCVRSKLRPGESNKIAGEDEEEEEVEEEDVECLENQSSKKRKGKAKPRTTKRALFVGKGAPGSSTGSDFFLKASGKKLLQKQLGEQEEAGDSILGNDKCCKTVDSGSSKKSCRQLKEKREGDAKPYKDMKSNEGKRTPNKRKMMHPKFDVANNVDGPNECSMPCTAFDLRMEAKIAAEENARMSAGKETHPFFSSKRLTKRSEEIMESMEVESKCCLFMLGEEMIRHPPVHITQTCQDDILPLDWKNWICFDGNLLSSIHNFNKNKYSSVFESAMEPLKFDTCSVSSNSHGTSFPWKEFCSDHLVDSGKIRFAISRSAPVLADMQEEQEQLLEQSKVHEMNKNSLLLSSVNHVGESLLQERMESHLHCSNNRHDCSLWINKYQPLNASEVCGNGESVKRLSEWLPYWHDRDPETRKNPSSTDRCLVHDSECRLSLSDCDVESEDEVKNVFLLTGPIGSGKSAAIYACAKEQGFQVIEVNASDWRSGALVKQKFGEAMESHGFQKWSLEEPPGSQENWSAKPDSTAPQKSKNGLLELSSESCKQDLNDEIEASENVIDNKCVSNQGANKTLILFEDVDTNFDEDRGFIATLLQLAETAKRPIILTSNNKDPILPELLDREVADFTVPPLEELVSRVNMVCAAEDIKVSPELIRHFIRCFHGDIRKIIMQLQFWCQGTIGEERKTCYVYSPLQFDLDAGHHIIPKVIPWGFPCQLSELVAKEISKTQSLLKENEQFMELKQEDEFDSEEKLDALVTCKNETDSIKARKEALLSRNCSVHEDAEHLSTRFDVGEISNSDDSPVTYTRRTSRLRLHSVLSSDSGDELVPDSFANRSDTYCPVAPTNGLSQDVSGGSSFQRLSLVPESTSFVPETRINDRYEFPTVIGEDTSFSGMKPIESMPCVEVDNLGKSVVELDGNREAMFLQTCEVDAESVDGNEELGGESQNEHTEAVSRVYPLMDECSRADFRAGFIRIRAETSRHPVASDLIQETWKKLRTCGQELKSYITSGQRDVCRIVKLAAGMTDLISETDVMLCRCQPLISDSLEPSMVPEPDAMCWHDQQLELASTFAEHGLCFYAKRSAEGGIHLGFENEMCLAEEMLSASTNTAAIGKLITQQMGEDNCTEKKFRIENSSIYAFFGRELESRLSNILLSVLPTRSYLTLKGAAFLDYLSFLGHFLKLKIDPTSESSQRGVRAQQRSLKAFTSAFSSEDVQLLAQHSRFDVNRTQLAAPT